MPRILYEVSYEFEPVWLLAVLMLVGTGCVPWRIRKAYEGKSVRLNMRVVKIVCAIAFAVELLLFVFLGIGHGILWKQTIDAYRSGNYQIAEGIVENYCPYPLEGRSGASFELGGVGFSYSDADIQPGYHNTGSHKGAITDNGQRLKIGYVTYDRIHDPIIVYIEEIEN